MAQRLGRDLGMDARFQQRTTEGVAQIVQAHTVTGEPVKRSGEFRRFERSPVAAIGHHVLIDPRLTEEQPTLGLFLPRAAQHVDSERWE